MRILTVLHDLEGGGTQRVAQNFAIGFKTAGHESAVLAYATGGIRTEALRDHGIPVFIGAERIDDRGIAIDQAAAWKPDIVHIHRPGDASLETDAIVRRLKNASSHRLPVCETNIFGKPDFSEDGRLIDVHLHLTRWSFWKWQQWTRGLHPRPLGVLFPNVVDDTVFFQASPSEQAEFRQQHGIPEDATLFGRIGQPIAVKWSTILLDAFERVASRKDRCWLLLVGAPDSILHALQKRSPSVRSRVVSIPFINGDRSLRTAFSTLDVFLHASEIGESFGMVLAEALLCGTPVISLCNPLRDNGQMELVGHRRGGLLVRDTAGMARAMQDVMDNPEQGRAMGVAGGAHVRAMYATRQVLPRIVELFQSVIESKLPSKLGEVLKDSGFITRIDTDEIRALYRSAIGRPPLLEWPAMQLVHIPWFYRVRQSYRIRNTLRNTH